MSHVYTIWGVSLCQMPGGVNVKNLVAFNANAIECQQCKGRHFAMMNKQDFYVSNDRSVYLFPLVRNTTPEDQPVNPTRPDFVIIDDHDQNIGITANEYDIFLQRFLDWRVNK